LRDSGTIVRPVAPSDVAAVTRIYAHYVLHSLATFEVTPPDEAELGGRIEAVGQLGLPFLVADGGGEILGYAYGAPYRPRPAYRFTVEESVYVAPEARGRGLGRLLLGEVVDACAAAGMRQAVAVIADTGDRASVRLHERCGFSVAGRLSGVGVKHGQWLDTILMQRPLAA
jgi:phosphinothricin acetyltransferase